MRVPVPGVLEGAADRHAWKGCASVSGDACKFKLTSAVANAPRNRKSVSPVGVGENRQLHHSLGESDIVWHFG